MNRAPAASASRGGWFLDTAIRAAHGAATVLLAASCHGDAIAWQRVPGPATSIVACLEEGDLRQGAQGDTRRTLAKFVARARPGVDTIAVGIVSRRLPAGVLGLAVTQPPDHVPEALAPDWAQAKPVVDRLHEAGFLSGRSATDSGSRGRIAASFVDRADPLCPAQTKVSVIIRRPGEACSEGLPRCTSRCGPSGCVIE